MDSHTSVTPRAMVVVGNLEVSSKHPKTKFSAQREGYKEEGIKEMRERGRDICFWRCKGAQGGGMTRTASG